jgi:hypothetical protein
MKNFALTSSSLAIARMGKDTQELLFGVPGPAPAADAFAMVLGLASEQVQHLTDPQSWKASLARLAALHRLAPALASFIPTDVAAQVLAIGRSCPHTQDVKARVRDAVVHAVLLLELRGGLSRTESSIHRNLWKIERIAADLLTAEFRAQGGSDKIRVSPEPVTAPTIKAWLRRYEADPVWGLFDRPRRPRRPASRDLEQHTDVTRADPAAENKVGHEHSSNVVPFVRRGQGRNPGFVPWWLKDFS